MGRFKRPIAKVGEYMNNSTGDGESLLKLEKELRERAGLPGCLFPPCCLPARVAYRYSTARPANSYHILGVASRELLGQLVGLALFTPTGFHLGCLHGPIRCSQVPQLAHGGRLKSTMGSFGSLFGLSSKCHPGRHLLGALISAPNNSSSGMIFGPNCALAG